MTLNKFFIIFLVSLIGFSCKKGENDPFLSLRSRDTRITGEWELVSMEGTSSSSTTTNGTTSTVSNQETFEGGTVTSTTSSSDGSSSTDIYAFSQDLIIEKTGEYSVKTSYDGSIEEFFGAWWWINDSKKKTRIAFDDDFGSTIIDRLTNKEMTLISESESSSLSSGGNSSMSTSKVVYKYEKK